MDFLLHPADILGLCPLHKRSWNILATHNFRHCDTTPLANLPILDVYGYTGWHVDHIIPCAAFDLTKPAEQAKCFHYSNLQPLWATDNYRKSNKII